MTTETTSTGRERGQLAAEYVLGVLDHGDRQRCQRLIDSDPAFAAAVGAWEKRLAPLNAQYEEVQAPARLFAEIEQKLFAGIPQQPKGIWYSLSFWRVTAFAAMLGLVVLAGLNTGLFAPKPADEGPQLVATLAAEDTDVRFAALYDASTATMRINHIDGAIEAGHDFELWFIHGENPPVSLGVVKGGGALEIEIAPGHRAAMSHGTILAISDEPKGGSQTGAPTGPVVAVGEINQI